MRIYTTAKLSDHMEQTPEGYLLCLGAALARTGTMQYLPEEVDAAVVDGFDGDQVLIYRDADEVFSPATLASFEGKPLTMDHPEEDVAPENWSALARGIVLNVRRGDGAASDLMLGDILIMDAEAIEAVQGGLRELSCGYDAGFKVIRPGVGRQINIRGNHVALVDHARGGPRLKIKDKRETPMKKDKKSSWMDSLRKLLKDAEAEENKAAQDEEQPIGDDEQPVTTTDDDVAASLEEIKLLLRTIVEGIKPQQADEETSLGDDDTPLDEEESTKNSDTQEDEETPQGKTNDRKPRRLADADTVRRAQRMGLSGCRVGDSGDAVRRGALSLACRDADTRRIVEGILGDTPLSRARPDNVRAAFMAVSALAGDANNRRTTDSLTRSGSGSGKGRAVTPADINKLNADFYKGGK